MTTDKEARCVKCKDAGKVNSLSGMCYAPQLGNRGKACMCYCVFPNTQPAAIVTQDEVTAALNELRALLESVETFLLTTEANGCFKASPSTASALVKLKTTIRQWHKQNLGSEAVADG